MLKIYRKKAKLSQVELSKLSGVTQATISEAENGSIITIKTALALVRALNAHGTRCTVEKVFGADK